MRTSACAISSSAVASGPGGGGKMGGSFDEHSWQDVRRNRVLSAGLTLLTCLPIRKRCRFYLNPLLTCQRYYHFPQQFSPHRSAADCSSTPRTTAMAGVPCQTRHL